jgi:hypothetical protein
MEYVPGWGSREFLIGSACTHWERNVVVAKSVDEIVAAMMVPGGGDRCRYSYMTAGDLRQWCDCGGGGLCFIGSGDFHSCYCRADHMAANISGAVGLETRETKKQVATSKPMCRYAFFPEGATVPRCSVLPLLVQECNLAFTGFEGCKVSATEMKHELSKQPAGAGKEELQMGCEMNPLCKMKFQGSIHMGQFQDGRKLIVGDTDVVKAFMSALGFYDGGRMDGVLHVAFTPTPVEATVADTTYSGAFAEPSEPG